MSSIWLIWLRWSLIFSIALFYSAKPMLHSFVKYAGWHDKLANFATIKAHRDVGAKWAGWAFTHPFFKWTKVIKNQLSIADFLYDDCPLKNQLLPTSLEENVCHAHFMWLYLHLDIIRFFLSFSPLWPKLAKNMRFLSLKRVKYKVII